MVKLIRYASEGFKPFEYYPKKQEFCPKFIRNDNRIELFVYGCYVFIEEVDLNALSNISGDRYYEKRNELLVNEETLIWTRNEIPILKNNKLRFIPYYKIENKLLWNSWVKIPAKIIKEKVKLIKRINGFVDYEYCEGIFEC